MRWQKSGEIADVVKDLMFAWLHPIFQCLGEVSLRREPCPNENDFCKACPMHVVLEWSLLSALSLFSKCSGSGDFISGFMLATSDG